MSVHVVFGGQYGSEGKGKVAIHLAKKSNSIAGIRVGGSNAGHTVTMHDGTVTVFRQIPSACVIPGVVAILAPGSYVNPALLQEEIDRLAAHTPVKPQVYIDRNAIIIEPTDIMAETGIKNTIGSTGSGTGAAAIKRIRRSDDLVTAGQQNLNLRNVTVCDTHEIIQDFLSAGANIILEGTQGFGLSIYHALYYPFCTSRDTTVMAALSESGIPIQEVDHIAMTIRARSIRVGGNSGPMSNEIDWKTVNEESAAKQDFTEHTSVTKKVRRVGDFDPALVRRAIAMNGPTLIYMNHLDQIDAACHNEINLTPKAWDYINKVEHEIGKPIDFVGTGPETFVEVRGHERVF